MQHESPWAALAATVTIILALASQTADAQTSTTIDLPAQALSESIRAIARQAQLNIVVDPRLVEGRQAPALKVEATPQAALSLLLADTGITVRFVEEHTVALVAAN